MISWIIDKIDQWQINRYLKFCRKGFSSKDALNKAWLTPDAALRILERVLNGNLSHVGVITFSRGRFSSKMNETQLTLVLTTMAELSPTLSEDKRIQVRQELTDLANHNWGYVRSAASAALGRL